MELTRGSWSEEQIPEFQDYLKSFENPAKREWCTNILQTKMPVLCLATPLIKNITGKISKGNYLQFLDLMIWEYYENTAINGFLIAKIKDFPTMKHYLDIYSSRADNWATCDLLALNVKGEEEKFINLTLEYIKNEKPFVRRIGLNVLLGLIKNEDYINKIFSIIDLFDKEEQYYVNMMIAWLLSECFIKQREKTLAYMRQNKLNKFAFNKGIQKCRESRRVSAEDKAMLLELKKE